MKRLYWFGSALLCLGLSGAAAVAALKDDRPAIFIAGDSTAAAGSSDEQRGWAWAFADFFDSEQVRIENRARGGRSSRTFITEGHWAELLEAVRPGDWVLIQLGHNDGGAINEEPPGSNRPLRARGSLPGIGDEQEAIDNVLTEQHEVVYTFGHYLRQMVEEVQAKGAYPVLMSLTVRNIWSNGRLERGSGQFGAWSYQVAREAGIPFIDVSNRAADRLEPIGPKLMNLLYPRDHTHTGAAGARVHAEVVLSGLKGLRPSPIQDAWLNEAGEAVETDGMAFLGLPFPADARKPSLFLIGDSTVRNGRGDGAGGEWGWGDFLGEHLDAEDFNIVNRAVGGLSSRTFRTGGYWERVKSLLRPGDVLVIQFGHNDSAALNDDSRARGTIRGTGSEMEFIQNQLTGKPEMVFSYGEYLRRYVAEALEMGVTPVICSPVPRKVWDAENRIVRNPDSYPAWAREVAESAGIAFIDLHESIARRYDAMGPEAVDALFADERTHTSREGARLNAEVAADALVSKVFNKND